MEKVERAVHPITVSKDLYMDELSKASLRIGNNINSVAIWFARFAERKLQNLSTGGWNDLLYEVASLSEFQYQLTGERALWSVATTMKDWEGKERIKGDGELEKWLEQCKTDINDGFLTAPLPPYALPPRDAVASLQMETIGALNELHEDGTYSIALPPVSLIICAKKTTDEIARLGILGTPLDLFRYNLAWTIGMSAVRIRRCSECNTWFFADRKNKTYCSSRCQTRAGTRRYRAADDGPSDKPTSQTKKGRRHGKKK